MAEGGIVVAICQYGGEFTSGPNGNLIYKGGEAHAVDVSREMSLDSFKDEVSKVFHVDVTDMSFKYFLPNNNRTLITISCDKDLQRMVDFTASAAQADVFVISRVENRSIVTYSGALTVKPGSSANGDKRKRPSPKKKASKSNTNTPTATATAVQANTNDVNQPRPVVTLNDYNGDFQLEFGHDVALATTAEAVSSAPDVLNQEKLALVDNTPRCWHGFCRDPVGLFDDAINAYDGSEIIIDPPQEFNDNPTVSWDDIIKGVGQEFDNVKDFRAQLCKYAIGKGFVYRFIKNETTRVTVKCVGDGCTWRLHASESSRNKKFVIKKMTGEHTCGGGDGEGQRRATRQWLTTVIKEKLSKNSLLKPKDLVNEIYEGYGVLLTYSQVWRGREVAQKEMFHVVRETFGHLPWYKERLLQTNPGSILDLSGLADTKFRRFFFAFHASLYGFANGCRPLLFLDKVPLKATNEYKLLVAAAVDADDGVFPVAFNVVEDENFDSWVSFLTNLRFALEHHNYPLNVMTFLSNGQKGLDAAVPHVFEGSHHAFCLHHIMEEFKGELKKGPWSQQIRDAMVEDFTRAAQACSIDDFNASIESIRNISTEAADWIIASKPEHWSDAIFAGCRYDHFSSNIVDAFNNWIPTKKEGSMVLMMDSLRIKITETIEARREACMSWSGPLTPSMDYKAQDEMAKAGKLIVLCSSETVFEVRGSGIFVVNLANWECTCRRWQLSGLPCMHAVAVFNRIGRSFYDYCSKFFRIESYHLTYSGTIFPIPDMDSFDFTAGATIPPPKPRTSDKPRRKRINPNKTTTLIRLCSRCKQVGHNKATCEAIL
ncbi:uncharacterized protein LOC100842134 isoform X3 [Brachypodium distachyon]|nr:uncharacterized protein LOC100842134 isoform X3 [Brachypodium distachyon]XP_024314003.1 uncharacterized protein LOC100842134 isoform X3 [Brachypodium distachyon]XP_024314004.1 uncharacterized protein LOC100842134 isoform X3 [Brachypodium distachyon]|eukprot:XP_024314002.1 uncharacterized protein LOC100842134 isoform X3 [Brachypodium distachyon]